MLELTLGSPELVVLSTDILVTRLGHGQEVSNYTEYDGLNPTNLGHSVMDSYLLKERITGTSFCRGNGKNGMISPQHPLIVRIPLGGMVSSSM
jgi:hypothetical protein